MNEIVSLIVTVGSILATSGVLMFRIGRQLQALQSAIDTNGQRIDTEVRLLMAADARLSERIDDTRQSFAIALDREESERRSGDRSGQASRTEIRGQVVGLAERLARIEGGNGGGGAMPPRHGGGGGTSGGGGGYRASGNGTGEPIRESLVDEIRRGGG